MMSGSYSNRWLQPRGNPMDLNASPVLLFFSRLIDLIALPIDLFRAGHWVGAIVALLLQLLLLVLVLYLGGLYVTRRRNRNVQVVQVPVRETPSGK